MEKNAKKLKKLTVSEAQKMAKKYFFRMKKSDRAFFLNHSKSVVETALILSSQKGAKKSALSVAGWVHDIGYWVNHKNHANHSIKLLEKEGYFLDEVVRDCILNHGTDGTPKTAEGVILRMADKISVFDRGIIEVMIDSPDSGSRKEMFKLLRMMSEQALNQLHFLK